MLKSVAPSVRKAVSKARFAIVASRYNERYVNGMLRAARATLREAGVRAGGLKVVRVPGAFEMPAVVAKLTASEGDLRFDAVIGLGVILQGATSHAEHIGGAVTSAFAQIQVQYMVPIVHEVLVFTNVQQAKERCLSREHNRGAEAAQTALEMARVMRNL